jgi:hypothetical protein
LFWPLGVGASVIADTIVGWSVGVSAGVQCAVLQGAAFALYWATETTALRVLFAPLAAQTSWIGRLGYLVGGEIGAAGCASQLGCHQEDLARMRLSKARWYEMAKARLNHVVAWTNCLVGLLFGVR